MQESQFMRNIFGQATVLVEGGNLSTALLYLLQEFIQNAPAPGTILTTWDGHDAIIDVDSHECFVPWRSAVDVIRVHRRVVPAFLRRGTYESLEDDAAAHGLVDGPLVFSTVGFSQRGAYYNVRQAPRSVVK